MNFFVPESIYSKQETKHDNNETVVFYTVSGQEDYLSESFPAKKIESDKVYAKKTLRKDNSIKYSIKTSRDGKLFNPIPYYDEDKTSSNENFLDRVCKSNEKFKAVSAKTFDLYLMFLKTKNIAWLKNAERETE